MASDDLITKFKALKGSPSSFPDLASFDDDRLRAFWVLWVASKEFGIDQLSASGISDVLRDAFGIRLSRQKIESILSNEKAAIVRRKSSGRRVYQIMQSGIDSVASSSPDVIFVDPAKALSKIRHVQSVLAGLKGDLCICDPYVDPKTLDYLADCTSANSIRLLTMNVSKVSALKRDLAAFAKEHGKLIEIRLAPRGVLHDRYVVHDDGLLLVGTSLNSLGAKQSFVVALGPDIRASVAHAFERTWSAATPGP